MRLLQEQRVNALILQLRSGLEEGSCWVPIQQSQSFAVLLAQEELHAGKWDRGQLLGFGVALRCSAYRACYALSLPLLPSPASFILRSSLQLVMCGGAVPTVIVHAAPVSAVLLSLSCCESPRQVIAKSSQSGAFLSCSCSPPGMRTLTILLHRSSNLQTKRDHVCS